MTDARNRLRRATVAAYRSAPDPPAGEPPEPPLKRQRRRPERARGTGTLTAARVGIVVLILGLLGGGVLMLTQRPAAPLTPLPTPEPAAVAESQVQQSPAPPAESESGALVHVAGAVHEPGLVDLPPGSRIADGLDAAGGALDSADLNAVNLVAPVTDGEQVYLPTEEENAPPAGNGSGSVDPGGAGSAPDPVIDLNTADSVALESLPGIGPARAAEIISWREAAGGFTSVDQLLQVSGIGPATLERLRDRVRV